MRKYENKPYPSVYASICGGRKKLLYDTLHERPVLVHYIQDVCEIPFRL
jgi:hypothetical protein